MSARPRPVTATFKPKSMQPPVKPRSYSLSSGGSTDSLTSILDHSSCESPSNQSSGSELNNDNECINNSFSNKKKSNKSGSTESLVSVLDHDSCEELELSDNEPQVKEVPPKPQVQEKKKRYRRHTHESVENGMRRHKACIDDIESKQKASCSRQGSVGSEAEDDNERVEEDDGLTPWERWLLQKAKEDREKVKLEIRKKKKEQLEERKKQEEKQNKQKKGEEKFTEWLEKKGVEEKRKVKQQNRQEKVKADIENGKKQEIEEKANRKYDEWLSQKKNQEKENKRKEQEEKERKQKEKEDILKRSEIAYEEWCNKVQNRPRSAQRNTSFGYTSGKLTGYYDTSAYPAPTFYNPHPWQPNDVPRPKSEKPKRSKSKSKYKWNPNKYL